MNDLETCAYVFVYGTLMSGFGNSRLLTHHEAELIGPRVTQDSYLLGNVGFPYLFKKETVVEYLDGDEDYFKPVVGELWRLPSDNCLKSLDRLEGYPSHYGREVITLKTGEQAWAYIQQDATAIFHCYACRVTYDNEWSWK